MTRDIIIAIMALVLCVLVMKLSGRGRVSKVDAYTRDLIDEINNNGTTFEEAIVGMNGESRDSTKQYLAKSANGRRQINTLAIALGTECRSKFMFANSSEANRLVAHKWIYDHLIKVKAVRKSDHMAIISVATTVALCPTDMEILLKRVGRSTIVAQAHRDLTTDGPEWYDPFRSERG